MSAGELRYLTMSFWGYDGRAHTGEMIVNARVADAVTRVFGHLFEARFPIEEMRVVAAPELTRRRPATATTRPRSCAGTRSR